MFPVGATDAKPQGAALYAHDQKFGYRYRHPAVECEPLGYVPDQRRSAIGGGCYFDPAFVRNFAKQRHQQRRLPGTVGADDACAATLRDHCRDLFQNRNAAKRHRHVVKADSGSGVLVLAYMLQARQEAR